MISISSTNTQGNKQGVFIPVSSLGRKVNVCPIRAEVARLKSLGHTDIKVEEVIR
jgi:hypothetical protein